MVWRFCAPLRAAEKIRPYSGDRGAEDGCQAWATRDISFHKRAQQENPLRKWVAQVAGWHGIAHRAGGWSSKGPTMEKSLSDDEHWAHTDTSFASIDFFPAHHLVAHRAVLW